MLTKKRLRSLICSEYKITKELLDELKELDPESGMLGSIDNLNKWYSISANENMDIIELTHIHSTMTNVRGIILNELNLQKQKKENDFLIAEIRKNTERLKQLEEQLSKGCGKCSQWNEYYGCRKCEDDSDDAKVEAINNYITNLQKEIDEDKKKFDSEG